MPIKLRLVHIFSRLFGTSWVWRSNEVVLSSFCGDTPRIHSVLSLRGFSCFFIHKDDSVMSERRLTSKSKLTVQGSQWWWSQTLRDFVKTQALAPFPSLLHHFTVTRHIQGSEPRYLWKPSNVFFILLGFRCETQPLYSLNFFSGQCGESDSLISVRITSQKSFNCDQS